jgi:hypothetical protein
MIEFFMRKEIAMNRRRVTKTSFVVMVLLVVCGKVEAGILTFEDVPGGSLQLSSGDMPAYEGFIFSTQLDWIDLTGPPGYAFNYGAHSGQFAMYKAFSGGRIVVQAEDGSDFTFDGLWAKKWATAPESGGIDDLFGTLSGTNNGTLVWSVNTSLNGSYEFYGAQAGAIDTLVLGFGGTAEQFIVDDLSLNASVGTVPEPASLTLWAALGSMGICFRRRRRRQAT